MRPSSQAIHDPLKSDEKLFGVRMVPQERPIHNSSNPTRVLAAIARRKVYVISCCKPDFKRKVNRQFLFFYKIFELMQGLLGIW
jgi:hypothetical protein